MREAFLTVTEYLGIEFFFLSHFQKGSLKESPDERDPGERIITKDHSKMRAMGQFNPNRPEWRKGVR